MNPENSEFISLLMRSGWNQSEVARRLELAAPSVSRYVNGIDRPTKQTLRLFRLILAGEATEPSRLPTTSAASLEAWAEPLLRDLRALGDADRAAVLDMAEKLARMVKRRGTGQVAVPRAGVNYGTTSKVAAAARGGAPAALRLARESAPKPKAAATTVRKSSPKPGARPASK